MKLLKERLTALNLDTRGAKPQLVARLEAALRWQQPGHAHDPTAQQAANTEAAAAEEDVKEEQAAADAAPATPPQSKRARGEGAATAAAAAPPGDEAGKAGGFEEVQAEAVQKAGADGDSDSDSAVTLDRAEQALTDSMAPPPAVGVAAVVAAAAAGEVLGLRVCARESPVACAVLHLHLVCVSLLPHLLVPSVPPVVLVGDGVAAAAEPKSDLAATLRRHSVAQLRLDLQRRRLPSSGVKAVLVERLAAAMAADGAAAAAAAAAMQLPESPVAVAAVAVAADSPALRTPVAQTTAPAAPMGPRKGPRPAEPQSVETPTIAAAGVGGAAAGLSFAAAATTPPTVEGPAAAPAASTAGGAAAAARAGAGGKYDITPGIQGLRMTSAKVGSEEVGGGRNESSQPQGRITAVPAAL